MTGGAGSDVFVFAGGDSAAGGVKSDHIADFAQAEADRIDLSAIDAIAGGVDDPFSFVGAAAFSGVAGELRAVKGVARTVISGDTNGDKVADFAIIVDKALDLAAGDFVL